MKASRFSLWLIFVAVTLTVSPAFGATWSPALGAWLPDPNTGFDAWSKGQAAVISQFDYFVCSARSAPSENTQSLYYAGSACGTLKNGTAFVYGAAEPIRSAVVYDAAHRIVLYDKGCCAWRGYALTANVTSPPKPVNGANLSHVRTMRGVMLGLTRTQVLKIYGPARAHVAKGRSGFTTLTYTTMKGTPAKPAGDACGQFQSFTFRGDQLVSIELLAGC
jgi:hypothetical protein